MSPAVLASFCSVGMNLTIFRRRKFRLLSVIKDRVNNRVNLYWQEENWKWMKSNTTASKSRTIQ